MKFLLVQMKAAQALLVVMHVLDTHVLFRNTDRILINSMTSVLTRRIEDAESAF